MTNSLYMKVWYPLITSLITIPKVGSKYQYKFLRYIHLTLISSCFIDMHDH
jgi:hypothetical protein